MTMDKIEFTTKEVELIAIALMSYRLTINDNMRDVDGAVELAFRNKYEKVKHLLQKIETWQLARVKFNSYN